MYAVNFKQVGNNIVEMINKLGITQQKLADEIGISKQVMSKIINGKKAINVAELSKIATILGVSTDDLLVPNNNEDEKPSLFCIGKIRDEEARKNVAILLEAIEQIHLLEDLLDE